MRTPLLIVGYGAATIIKTLGPIRRYWPDGEPLNIEVEQIWAPGDILTQVVRRAAKSLVIIDDEVRADVPHAVDLVRRHHPAVVIGVISGNETMLESLPNDVYRIVTLEDDPGLAAFIGALRV